MSLVLRRRAMSAPAPPLPPIHTAEPRPDSPSPTRAALRPFHAIELSSAGLLSLLSGISLTLAVHIVLWAPGIFFPQLYLALSYYLSALATTVAGCFIAGDVLEREILYRSRENLGAVPVREVALAFAMCVKSCMLGRWIFGVALAATVLIWRGFSSVLRGFVLVLKGILAFFDAHNTQ